jgi:hypothetical protein
MMDFNVNVDSKAGMQILVDWARAHRFFLNEYHEVLAKKHGVSTDGVLFTRPIPINR